jgi:hypothetical protein
MLRCQAQLELTLMMCLGDRSTFTSTNALSDRSTFTSTNALSDRSTFTSIGVLSGRHDGSSPLLFCKTCCLLGVCVFARAQALSPPPRNLFIIIYVIIANLTHIILL